MISQRPGRNLFQSGRFEEALKEFEKALKSNPDLLEPRILRAHALKFLGRWEEASAQFDQLMAGRSLAESWEFSCLRTWPEEGWSASLRVRVWRDLERRLRFSLRRDAGNFWLRLWLGEVQIARSCPEKLRHLEAAWRLKPRHPWACLLLGQGLWTFRRYEEALKIFESSPLLRRDPPARYLALRGECKFWMGDSAAAAKDFERCARQSSPKNLSFFLAWRGLFSLWIGEYSKAAQIMDAVLSISPGWAWAYGWKGAALYKLGRKEEALRWLKENLRLNPQDQEAPVWIGEILRVQGRESEALKWLNPRSPEETRWWALINRALLWIKKGNASRAENEIRLLRADKTMNHFIRRAAKRRDSQEALEACLKAALGNRAHLPSPFHFQRL